MPCYYKQNSLETQLYKSIIVCHPYFTAAKIANRGLTALNELQSRAFVAYFGMPEQFPPAETIEQILDKAKVDLAQGSIASSVQRPDGWKVADNLLGCSIGICALLGGVYGTRAAGFLKQAKEKSQALKEIIEGNEVFKKENDAYAVAFKQAQKNQSPQTKKIVTELKW